MFPSDTASDSVYSIPLLIRYTLSLSIPASRAISSAVRNPTPSISSASLYGFSSIILYTSLPYILYTLFARLLDIPNFCRKTMTFLTSCLSSTKAPISWAFLRDMPFILDSISGSSSITRNVSLPNASTIFLASDGPIPFTAPEERYRRISLSSSAAQTSYREKENCLPYTEWVTYSPESLTFSPSLTACKAPTQVISPVSVVRSNTVYPLSLLE